MTKEEQKNIQSTIDEIWGKHDKNKDQLLNKIEARKFVISALGKLGHSFHSDQYDTLFSVFDKNNDEHI